MKRVFLCCMCAMQVLFCFAWCVLLSILIICFACAIAWSSIVHVYITTVIAFGDNSHLWYMDKQNAVKCIFFATMEYSAMKCFKCFILLLCRIMKKFWMDFMVFMEKKVCLTKVLGTAPKLTDCYDSLNLFGRIVFCAWMLYSFCIKHICIPGLFLYLSVSNKSVIRENFAESS